MPMKCEICGRNPQDGTSIFRVNPTGIEGIWRCRNCIGKPIDSELDFIVSVIEKRYQGDERAKDSI